MISKKTKEKLDKNVKNGIVEEIPLTDLKGEGSDTTETDKKSKEKDDKQE